VTPFYDSNGAGNRSGIKKKKRRCKNHQHAVDGSSAHSTDDLRLGKPPVTLKYHLQSLSQRVSSILYISLYPFPRPPFHSLQSSAIKVNGMPLCHTRSEFLFIDSTNRRLNLWPRVFRAICLRFLGAILTTSDSAIHNPQSATIDH